MLVFEFALKGIVTMEVAFVILNWNKADMTIQTVKNVQSTEIGDFAVVVVDNGSEMSEKIKLVRFAQENNWKIIDEEECPDTSCKRILVLASFNYGYAKGNNIGLKLAKSLRVNWAIVMNNDVVLEESVVNTLLNVARSDRKIAVVGPKIVGLDGKKQGPFGKPGLYDRVFYPLLYPVLYPLKKLAKRLRLSKSISTQNNVIYPYRIMGCFFLLNLDAMEKVGWFDEGTFLYGEELILSEKLLRHGYRVAYTERTYVKHIHEATTSQLGKKRDFMQLESELYYFRKYRGYGKVRLTLVKFGFLYSYFVLVPVLEFLKKLVNRWLSTHRNSKSLQ